MAQMVAGWEVELQCKLLCMVGMNTGEGGGSRVGKGKKIMGRKGKKKRKRKEVVMLLTLSILNHSTRPVDWVLCLKTMVLLVNHGLGL